MRFVSGKDTLKTVAEFLNSENVEIALAVAFWGGDAMNRLGVAEWKAKNVRVICNATSGACNPQALKDLQSHIGSNLRTNPKLHSKVYWTPSKLVITSANASASGLSLQDKEVNENIEAGIVSTSLQLLTEAKQWFDEKYDSAETVEVDEKIIKRAGRMWLLRRRGRVVPGQAEQTFTVTDALRDGAALEDRNIWVVNYETRNWTPEEKKQDEILKDKWNKRRLIAPVVADCEVKFDGMDDYVEFEESLSEYHWNSWVIDLVSGGTNFWFVPDDKLNIIKIPKTKTTMVPIYRARKVPFGDQWMVVSSTDIKELTKRWIGPKKHAWVPLQEFADSC